MGCTMVVGCLILISLVPRPPPKKGEAWNTCIHNSAEFQRHESDWLIVTQLRSLV